MRPGNDLPEWSLTDFNPEGLTGDSLGTFTSGEITIETDASGVDRLILNSGNGDADSFELFGFSRGVAAGSAVYSWGGELNIGVPQLYTRARAIEVLGN